MLAKCGHYKLAGLIRLQVTRAIGSGQLLRIKMRDLRRTPANQTGLVEKIGIKPNHVLRKWRGLR